MIDEIIGKFEYSVDSEGTRKRQRLCRDDIEFLRDCRRRAQAAPSPTERDKAFWRLARKRGDLAAVVGLSIAHIDEELRNHGCTLLAEANEILARCESDDREVRASENRALERLYNEVAAADELRSITKDLMNVDIYNTPGLGSPIDAPENRADVAWTSYLRHGDDHEVRAQGVATGAAGGYLAPQSFADQVVVSLKQYGGVRRWANVITTSNGNPLMVPTMDDTSNVGRILSESTTSTATDIAFGQKLFAAHMYTSDMIKASRQFVEDVAVNVDEFLAREIAKRIGRAQAADFATGNGASKPQGLVTGSTVGKTTASSSAITYGELVDLIHSVDAAYREEAEYAAGTGAPNTSVAWIMHDTTFAAIRKMVDSQNRPLVEPNVQAGSPSMLLGYPIQVDNSMAQIATGAQVIAFGNIRAAYTIRDVRGVEVLRLVERYADALQIAWIAVHRSDGAVVDSSAVKLLQMA